MLIDAGTEDSGTRLQLYLQKQQVSSLDYLILTHPDADHIGGGDVMITKFNCGQVMMSNFTKDTASCRDVESALAYKGYQAITPEVGSTYSLGDAAFTIAGPVQTGEDANNSSIALLLTYGNTRFLFTGDAQEAEESDILASGVEIQADVYQAPSYAVISCEAGNSYGHPHAEVLNRFRSMGIKVFRTDEQGSIIAYSDRETITWNASPSESWQAGEPQGSSSKEVQAQQEYVLNTNTHKFHYADCSSVQDMSEKNKQFSNKSREEIIADGYKPCKRCNP